MIMTSVKLKFRPSTVAEKEGTLYFQVIHKRIIRQIRTEYHISAYEWDDEKGILWATCCDEVRKSYLLTISERTNWCKRLLDNVVLQLCCKPTAYTTDDIVREYLEQTQKHSFFNFMQEIIFQLKHLGKMRTAETYTATIKSFMKFRNAIDIPFEGFNSDIVLEYEAYLKARNLSLNTISFYMRILRAVYNRAVEKGFAEASNPFKHVYTGIEKTIKRAIDIKSIKKIKDLVLSNYYLDFSRDMFLFSFYTRGMSFVDMCYLKKSDLKQGVLSYRRHKTGQLLQIRWEKPMQEIVCKYNTTDSPYLLPIIRKVGINERKQYNNALHLINHKLKEIANMIGLSANLTLYTSRHSWASIAQSKNIPIAIISEGMGHDNEKTTQIYLNSLDKTIVDNANRLILNDLQ